MAQSKPSSGRARSFPVIPIFRQVERKAQVDAILNAHAYGNFTKSSQFCDEIMTDDRISGTVETRIGALLAAEVEIRPARDRRKERKLAELLGGIDDARGIWPSMVSPAAAFEMLKWGLLNGIAVAQIVWDRTPEQWMPRLCPWHPRHLRWDWYSRRLMLQTENMGEVALPDLEANPDGDGNWFVWAPHGLALGWINGMVRSLAMPYLARQWNFRDWARYNEKHGMALLKADVPAWAKPEDKDAWLQQLANLGSESAVACPVGQTKDAARFDLALVEAIARTWETFQAFKSSLDVDIAVRVLGQNLTTEGGTDGGSRALGQVHDLVRLDKAIEDSGIGEAFSRQVVGWWAFHNFGDRALAPSVIYHVEPPEDLAKEAAGLKTLGEGVQALELASDRVDAEAILEAQGIPMLTDEELAAKQAAAAEEAQAAMEAQNGDGDAGGDAGGGDGQGGGAGGDQTGNRPRAATAALSATAQRRAFADLPIVVEHAAGSIRIFAGPNGTETPVKMGCDYGFIDGFMGSDGEELDCYLGPDESAREVYVVHQLRAPEFRSHDEDKIMLGFVSAEHAREVYLMHRGEPRAYQGMSILPLDRFKAKLRRRGPESTSKIRASWSRTQTVTALMALATRVGSGPAGRRAGGRRKGQQYQDRLRRRAQQLAARALAVDIASIKGEIDKATSFEDLRGRIVTKFRHMNPAALAEIVRKTDILGHLSGRFEAIKEV